VIPLETLDPVPSFLDVKQLEAGRARQEILGDTRRWTPKEHCKVIRRQETGNQASRHNEMALISRSYVDTEVLSTKVLNVYHPLGRAVQSLYPDQF